MAEILKRGTLPEEYKFEGQCYHCGSIIRFELNEVSEKYDQQRDGSAFYEAECPVCEKTMYPRKVKAT